MFEMCSKKFEWKIFWKWERQVNSRCDDLKWRQFSPRIEPLTFDAHTSSLPGIIFCDIATPGILSAGKIQIEIDISKAYYDIASSICSQC